MDERRFDMLSRRVGAQLMPLLPRRGVMHLLGGTALAGLLGVLPELEADAKKNKNKNKKKKCKKEGKGCDKNKCKKHDKKCCCKNLKC